MRFDEIFQALSGRFRFSGVLQNVSPFTPGLGICDLRIGRTENNDGKWLIDSEHAALVLCNKRLMRTRFCTVLRFPMLDNFIYCI